MGRRWWLGAAQACATPDLDLILVGDQPRLEPMVARLRGVERGRVRIVHAEGVVLNEDKPSVALRQGVKTSMRKAIDLVDGGRLRRLGRQYRCLDGDVENFAADAERH